jgi:hypothetical protein
VGDRPSGGLIIKKIKKAEYERHITPLSLTDYLRYRMVAMVVPCLALSWVTVVLAGLTETTPLQLAVTAIVAAPLAPIYALFLARGAAAGARSQSAGRVDPPGVSPRFASPHHEGLNPILGLQLHVVAPRASRRSVG